MNKTIYEEFGCTTKEELYQKIKLNDESVKQLKAFIDFSKASYKLTEPIKTDEDVLKYISGVPEKDESKILFLNLRNIPVYLGTCNMCDEKSQRQMLLNGLNASGIKFFCINNPALEKHPNIQNFYTLIASCKLKIIDSIIVYEKNKCYFENSKQAYIFDENCNIKLNTKEFSKNKIQDLINYNEFTQYYCKQEMQGLNIFKDKEKINSLLKIAYQDSNYEVLGAIFTDKNGNVLDIENISYGDVKSVRDNSIELSKHLLRNENIKGIIKFHNHPSGKSSPSNKDLSNIEKNISYLDKAKIDFIDSYVIGKDGIFSIKSKYPELFTNKLSNINKPLFTFENNKAERNNIKDIENLINSISESTGILDADVRNMINKNAELKMFEDNNIKYTFNVEDYAIRKYTDNQEEIYKKYSSIGNFIEKDGDLELDM